MIQLVEDSLHLTPPKSPLNSGSSLYLSKCCLKKIRTRPEPVERNAQGSQGPVASSGRDALPRPYSPKDSPPQRVVSKFREIKPFALVDPGFIDLSYSNLCSEVLWKSHIPNESGCFPTLGLGKTSRQNPRRAISSTVNTTKMENICSLRA